MARPWSMSLVPPSGSTTSRVSRDVNRKMACGDAGRRGTRHLSSPSSASPSRHSQIPFSCLVIRFGHRTPANSQRSPTRPVHHCSKCATRRRPSCAASFAKTRMGPSYSLSSASGIRVSLHPQRWAPLPSCFPDASTSTAASRNTDRADTSPRQAARNRPDNSGGRAHPRPARQQERLCGRHYGPTFRRCCRDCRPLVLEEGSRAEEQGVGELPRHQDDGMVRERFTDYSTTLPLHQALTSVSSSRYASPLIGVRRTTAATTVVGRDERCGRRAARNEYAAIQRSCAKISGRQMVMIASTVLCCTTPCSARPRHYYPWTTHVLIIQLDE